ncbi:hypothetical protein P8C59_004179 [Phyllachora maydis]|uniref:RING-type domain-containing protein n=1 Tax=Phyllachora maydis TaxID=1825666 RepID=A0AAD9I321_9PEZI|nr:hypothetical protein P8C59_004179 [Phyllachora maydis]
MNLLLRARACRQSWFPVAGKKRSGVSHEGQQGTVDYVMGTSPSSSSRALHHEEKQYSEKKRKHRHGHRLRLRYRHALGRDRGGGVEAHVEATCPICQETIGTRNPDGIVEHWSTLPCGHRFGSYCIKHYLRVAAEDRPSCPVCRQPVYHACGHPVLPSVAQPPTSGTTTAPGSSSSSSSNDSSSSSSSSSSNDSHGIMLGSDAHLFALRFVKCNYCLEKLAEAESRKNTSKGQSSVRRGLRWLRFLDRNRRGESEGSSEDSEAPLDENQRRQESANNGDWQGPWVDPFPKPRDTEWEKWWIAQGPQGA